MIAIDSISGVRFSALLMNLVKFLKLELNKIEDAKKSIVGGYLKAIGVPFGKSGDHARAQV